VQRQISVLTATLTTTTAILAGSALMSPAAQAAPSADPTSCAITNVTPSQVVVGTQPELVQFGVTTVCDQPGSYTTPWAVAGRLIPRSAHASWFGACTYEYAGPQVFDCAHNGATTLNVVGPLEGTFTGDDMAGTIQPLFAYSFADLNGDDRDDDGDVRAAATVSSFVLLRKTTLSGPSVHKTSVRSGHKITLVTDLTRANWTTGQEQALDNSLTLQFSAEGQGDFHDVMTVVTRHGRARARVKVSDSGQWRFAFAGTSTDAASTSSATEITVTH
jgi:hypothetical protein